ncbi:MAG: glutathione ABC transporter permease, partial [Leptolyngbya sp. SIO1D8]|nr:glutathione ABC transporter permease [Leptolyngbya sp. SIO1D8]
SRRSKSAMRVSSSPSYSPPSPEWGAMLAAGRDYFKRAPWITTFPGLAIAITVLGFNLLGDALREALDPQQRT